MKNKFDMKNGGIEKVLPGLGLKWKYNGHGLYIVDCKSYDALIFSSDEFPGIYTIGAFAYLPENIEDKQLFMKTVIDTLNGCGYPDICSELVDDCSRLSLDVKYRSRYITRKGLEERLSYFSDAYNFFVGNVLIKQDVDRWLATNPEKDFIDYLDEEMDKSLDRHLTLTATPPRKLVSTLPDDSNPNVHSEPSERINAAEQGRAMDAESRITLTPENPTEYFFYEDPENPFSIEIGNSINAELIKPLSHNEPQQLCIFGNNERLDSPNARSHPDSLKPEE